MTNEKERLHHSRFPDSGGQPGIMLPDNAESALLNYIVYRDSSSEFKRKSQAFKLKFPLTRMPLNDALQGIFSVARLHKCPRNPGVRIK